VRPTINTENNKSLEQLAWGAAPPPCEHMTHTHMRRASPAPGSGKAREKEELTPRIARMNVAPLRLLLTFHCGGKFGLQLAKVYSSAYNVAWFVRYCHSEPMGIPVRIFSINARFMNCSSARTRAVLRNRSRSIRPAFSARCRWYMVSSIALSSATKLIS